MVYTNIAKQKLLLVKLTIFNPIFEYISILNILKKIYGLEMIYTDIKNI